MRRLYVFASAGFLGVTSALLGAGVAYADSPTVTFSGGCGLLGVGPHSEPDVQALTVSAMSPVRFVNGLPVRADLVLPGGKRYALSPGGDLRLPIASGPAEALMEPACGVGLLPTYRKVTIEVTPAPSGGGGTQSPPAPTPVASVSSSAARGVSASPVPESLTSPRVSPSAEPSSSVRPSAAVPDPQFSPAGSSSEPGAASEPVAAGEVPARASSLLAMVAAVCVMGVSAAAVRAIGSQRATRALRA